MHKLIKRETETSMNLISVSIQVILVTLRIKVETQPTEVLVRIMQPVKAYLRLLQKADRQVIPF